MRKSFSKIKHIQEANEILEKRVLTERKNRMFELIREDVSHVEPLLNFNSTIFAHFMFPEGIGGPIKFLTANGRSYTGPINPDEIAEKLKDFMIEDGTAKTLERFKAGDEIPKFIEINFGTSSTPGNNIRVAEYRKNYLKDIVKKALKKLYIKDDVIYRILENLSTSHYAPSSVPSDFYDVSKLPPNEKERYANITIRPLFIGGNEALDLTKIISELTSAVNPDGSIISVQRLINAIEKIGGYSDIVELNSFMKDTQKRSFQDFLNKTFRRSPKASKIIADYLDKKAQQSGKPKNTIRYVPSGVGSGGVIDLGIIE